MKNTISILVIFLMTSLIRAEYWSRIELPFGECTVNDISGYLDPLPVQKDIWVATDKGLAFIHRKGIDYWTDEVGLSKAPILCVVPRPPLESGVVYFGTDGDGIWGWGATESSKLKFLPENVVSKVHIIKNAVFGKYILIIGYGTKDRPSNEIFLTIDYSGGSSSDHSVAQNITKYPAQVIDITDDSRGWPIVLVKWFPPQKKPYTEILLFYESEVFYNENVEQTGTWNLYYDSILSIPGNLEARCLLNDNDKVFYIGTDKGMYKYSLIDKKMIPMPGCPITAGVNNLMKDSRGFIWASSDNGLYINDGSVWWRMKENAGFGLIKVRKVVENGIGDMYVIGDDNAVWELKWNLYKKPREDAINVLGEIAERAIK